MRPRVAVWLAVASLALTLPVETLCSGAKPCGDAAALTLAAEDDLSAGRTQQAVEKLQKAVALEPSWYVPASRLGVAYQVAGLDAAALQEYGRVQRIAFDTYDTSGSYSDEVKSLITQAEAYMTLLVNATRMEDGKRALFPHPRMSLVARGHAMEMRDRKYFSHLSPVASRNTVMDRFKLVFGYRPRLLAENLARRWRRSGQYTLNLAKVRQSHEDLMKSPGHKSNILLDEPTNFGIGLAVNGSGDYWVVQVFADMTGHTEY